MSKLVLNKLVVFVFGLAAGGLFGGIVSVGGESKDWLYVLVPFVSGLFYVFYSPDKK